MGHRPSGPLAAVASTAALLLLAGCAAPPAGSTALAADPDAAGDTVVVLFDATEVLAHGWRHLELRGATRYTVDTADGVLAIRARGRKSASGLIREVEVDVRRCGDFEWRWRVDAMQQEADLHEREREDVAASVFLLFGDPGPIYAPQRVPTLRYVWSSARHVVGDVVDSPYLPGTVRSLVVRAGDAELGRWVRERREPAADFERAFGMPPPEPVYAVVLFTDNDQTAEPVESWYAWGRLHCDADAAPG